MRSLAVAAVLATGLIHAAAAAEVAIYCGGQTEELALCREGAEAWAKESGNTVRVLAAPERSDERYWLYVDRLERQDDSVDVFQIDVIWPSALAPHLIDLKPFVPDDVLAAHLPAIVANNTVDGRLVAMPWFTDAGLLYYRKDLLERSGLPVPTTYGELAATALAIQAKERPLAGGELWGFVFQGNAYEGLTCNALEWISAYDGTILDADGGIAVDSPAAALALAQAASWVGTIAPPRVTRFVEEDARITFQLGNAVFMRNWPYAWALLQGEGSLVRDKVGVAPLPGGGPGGRQHSATLGGWQLAVSKYSKNQEAAASLVAYLTSPAEQKRRAIAGTYAPTVTALYDDSEVLAAAPFFADFKAILADAVARPSSTAKARYAQLSTAFWEAAHATLTGRGSAGDNLAALDDRLRLLRARGGW
ncbi:MAG: ABC transporter substrate-binding protein [Geminicoccaceae bacterium]